MKLIPLALVAAALVWAVPICPLAHADIIELQDGRKISGSLSRQGDTMVIRADDGQVITVAPSQVLKVTLTSGVTPAEAAEAEWTRLVLKNKGADDLETVIQALRSFALKYPVSPRSAEARNQAAVFELLSKNDAVKFRGTWIPRAQIDVKLKEWAEAARPALDLYRQGRMREALDAVKVVLAADDQNPDALALGGLAAYRSNTLGLAKTYFQNLATADPSSVLALNNLAVVTWMQRAQAEALLAYTRAVQARPDNRLLLDNIAEAINAYTGDKNGTPYRNLLRQFEPAEMRMQAEMGKKGMVRWGATWVTREQYEQLVKNRNRILDNQTRLESQYKALGETAAGFDGQIRQAQQDYDAALANVNYFNLQIAQQLQRGLDATALIAQRDLAVTAVDLAQRSKLNLEAQRAQFSINTQEYTAQAAKLKAALEAAQPAYAGLQRIMELGEDQTPPPPASVTVGPEMPALPSTIIINTPPPTPVVVPVPTPVYVPVPIGGDGRGRGRGRGDGPSTRPNG